MTVGVPHDIWCGESWAMSHSGAHPSPCQTTAKILLLGGLPWSRVLDWRSLQPGQWPHRGSSYNQQCSTSIAMWQAVPGYIVPVAEKVPDLTHLDNTKVHQTIVCAHHQLLAPNSHGSCVRSAVTFIVVIAKVHSSCSVYWPIYEKQHVYLHSMLAASLPSHLLRSKQRN